MAVFARKLFINWTTKKRQSGENSSAPEPTLIFHKYEQVPFEIVIVEPVPGRTDLNSFQRIDIANLTLSVTVNEALDDGSLLALQETWTKDTTENKFSGSLNLNTAAFNTWLGSTAEKSAYFEVQLLDSDGDRVKVVSEACLVRLGVLQTTTASPDPNQNYLTVEQAQGLFVPRILQLGENISWADTNGTIFRTVGTDANGTAIDDRRQ